MYNDKEVREFIKSLQEENDELREKLLEADRMNDDMIATLRDVASIVKDFR